MAADLKTSSTLGVLNGMQMQVRLREWWSAKGQVECVGGSASQATLAVLDEFSVDITVYPTCREVGSV